jgi:hypothetical protein
MTIARLKITLDDVEPIVVRRIEVPFDIKLSDLHLVIQHAMPWWNYHLYEFRARNHRWGLPDPDFDWPDMPRVLPAKGSSLAELIATAGTRTFKYLYDFGDGWEHKVRIEKTCEPVADAIYPRLVDASGRGPPEDVGGPWGYAEYLEAMANPNHERHAEMVEWRGPDFDPHVVDVAGIEKELANLAKRWSRSKSKRPRKAA